MKKLLLILFCLPIIGFGQNVYIPDANFKAYLVGEPLINTNGDSEIQVSEASLYSDTINCSNLNISDLTGIESFTLINALSCNNNNLTNLDLSNNIKLTLLYCAYNQISSINVSNNEDLIMLGAENNLLSSIDVSNNTNLVNLICYSNQLLSADVRNGNNQNAEWYMFSDNPNLECINVDNPTYSNNNWLVAFGMIDSSMYFSSNCNNSTLIQEHSTNKELLKVTDLLGREKKGTKNEPLLYIYDDGTVEKKIVIE